MLSHSVIKLNHMEMHCDDVEWIQEARYMGQGLDPANAVTNILTVPGCPTSHFRRRGYNKNSYGPTPCTSPSMLTIIFTRM
jgi:hypothetical protein